MREYLAFCRKLDILPQKMTSLRKYKKHIQLQIPLDHANKEHFIEAYVVNDSLKKAINYEKCD